MNKPELLKCPCCGDLPGIYPWGIGCYVCHCMRYACNFPYSVMANDRAGVIKAWNEEVLKYKENKYGG